MDNGLSPFAQNILYCKNNGLLEDEEGRAILQIFSAGLCDDTIARMVERRIYKHKFHQAFYGIIPFKTPKLTKGNYIIGLDQKQRELYSYIQFLNAHSLTVAGSGAGKTTASYFKIFQIAPHVKGLWLFDLRKREFSHIANQGINLHILTGRSLKINPLELPVGVTVQDWLPRVADTLVGVLGLPPRASKLLQTKLYPLYQKYENKKLYPTLYDLFEEIKRDKDSNHQARMAFLDSLEPVLLSLGPKVLAYRRGWSSNVLSKRRIVFEFWGYSEIDKNLLLNSLILSEFNSRIARGISNSKMNLWICLDEAQRLCSSKSHTSAIGDFIGLVRGTGIGLDLGLQNGGDVLSQIISNTATKILGRCGSMTDYVTIGHSMGLNAEQIHWAQMNLKPGLFIGQLGEGSWRYPFVFRVSLINLPRTIKNGKITDETLSDLSYVYASEFDQWGTPCEINTPSSSVLKSSLFASEQEYYFCKAVVDHPMQSSSAYPKLAKISSKSAKQIREQLVSKGFIKEHKLDTGGRGRSSILLEASPEGNEAIKKYEEQ